MPGRVLVQERPLNVPHFKVECRSLVCYVSVCMGGGLHGTLVVFRRRAAIIAGIRSHVGIAGLQTAAGWKAGSSVRVRGAAYPGES